MYIRVLKESKVMFKDVMDSNTVVVNKKTYLAVSFGRFLKFYNEDGEEENLKIRCKFTIQKILPYDEYFFLLGKFDYELFNGIQKMRSGVFSHPFTKIDQIFQIQNHLIFLHDGLFSTAIVKNLKIIQKSYFGDKTLFTKLYGEQVDDAVYILAYKGDDRFLIRIRLDENDKYKVTISDIKSGQYILRHLDNLLIWDFEGIWMFYDRFLTGDKQLTMLDKNKKSKLVDIPKTYPIFVYNIQDQIPNANITIEQGTLVFFKDGNILFFKDDYKFHQIGKVSSPIKSVIRMGSLLLCVSDQFMHFCRLRVF